MRDRLKKTLTLLKGIYSYNLLRYFKTLPPTALQVNITYRCNSKCQMCQIWKMRPRNELSFLEWQRIVTDPIFSEVKYLTIAGGEPVLHPELINLMDLFIKSMPKLQFLSLITNGFLTDQVISATKILSNLCQERRINLTVNVSLDGIGSVHDEMRRVPNAFERTKATILALKSLQRKSRLWLVVACVVCRKNLHHLNKIQNWCEEEEIPFNHQLIGFHETYVQNMDKKHELEFRKEDKERLYSLLAQLTSERSFKNPRSYLKSYYWNDMLHLYQGGLRSTPCPFLLDAFVLDSLGDVYYCLSERTIGNCRKDGNVSKIYYDPKNLAFRKKMAETSCLRCNSACFVASAITKDFKKFLWFYLTGRRGPVGVY